MGAAKRRQARGSAYDVGFGKPPVSRQFQKGQSGNPKGRPKKKADKQEAASSLESAQLANRFLIEEAYRTVTVREGEKTIELPVIKAVFRALGVSAMEGNRLSQATMAELVRSVEG